MRRTTLLLLAVVQAGERASSAMGAGHQAARFTGVELAFALAPSSALLSRSTEAPIDSRRRQQQQQYVNHGPCCQPLSSLHPQVRTTVPRVGDGSDDAGSRCRRLFPPSMVRAGGPKPPSRRRGSSLRRASTSSSAAAVTTSSVTTSTVLSTSAAVSDTPVKRRGAGAAGARKRPTRNGGDRSRGGKPKSALVAASAKQGNNTKTKKEKKEQVKRTRGKAFVIVCDAESVTHPELLDCINIVEELGTRDVGMIYADWRVTRAWRSYLYERSKADRFKMVQRDPLPSGSNPFGDDTMTVDVIRTARSDRYKNYEFCLVSSNDSMAELASRLRAEGRVVRGVGRRQAPENFLKNCDSFMYIDPANRYELLMDEGLVISVSLGIALAAAGQEKCDWVRMKTIVNSLHSWDLGLETPNWYGYTDYDEMIQVMDVYIQGVEATSGEVVLKVPPKPAKEVPRGLEEVARYLNAKWVSFTKDPKMNDILLACIPACVQAVALSRGEMKEAIRRFRQQM